ncbi:hypothetical protein ABZ372_44135, partial [Streptomyces sp. NPDC005921]
ETYNWGRANYVRLEPGHRAAHILTVLRPSPRRSPRSGCPPEPGCRTRPRPSPSYGNSSGSSTAG